MDAGLLPCPVGDCPAGALCEVYFNPYSRDPLGRGTQNCAPMPPTCTVGRVCECHPWFTASTPPAGGVPNHQVCYACVEKAIDAQRTSVTCDRY